MKAVSEVYEVPGHHGAIIYEPRVGISPKPRAVSGRCRAGAPRHGDGA